ncbi:hypothetical protein [Antarcticirhabdus aurantiaca]|uniref:Uncharacterized protein n=1 Tax=Antarcticirhabdus aurantiaca TaxID=2606717 RepID=A0ACD4NJ39_9HYPH|nr:hypothetical protein OXU80_18680 [Jeongeuplla avenae]
MTAAIRTMVENGFTMEQALFAAGLMEEELRTIERPQRTARQDRNRRYYERKKAGLAGASYSDASDDRKTLSDASDGSKTVSDAFQTGEGAAEPSLPQKEKSPPAPPLEKNTPTHPIPFEAGESAKPAGRGRAKPDAAKASLPDFIRPEVERGFREFRRKAGVPLTERAIQLVSKQLVEIRERGGDPNEALDLCCERGWRTVKVDWYLADLASRAAPAPRGAGPPRQPSSPASPRLPASLKANIQQALRNLGNDQRPPPPRSADDYGSSRTIDGDFTPVGGGRRRP